jgi:two-component system nitrate/nitrite response regulator NarL
MPQPSSKDRRSVVAVVIVIGARVYREMVAAALRSLTRIEVVGEAGDWGEAFAHVHRAPPDVLLVDAALATSGRATRLLAQISPHVRVVALAVDEDERAVLSCLEAGAAAYVGRDAPLLELEETIRRAAGGELLCSPRIAAALGRRICDLAADREQSADGTRLTAREIEIAHLVEQRMSNRDIAARLWIQVTTVKNHVHNILTKLQIHSRAELADWMRDAKQTPG